MFRLFLIIVFIVSLAGLWYLALRIHRFTFFQKMEEDHKILSWILAALPEAVVVGWAFLNTTAMLVVLIHLIVGWLLCDLIAFLVKKAAGKQIPYNYKGLAAILLAVVYLGAGWYFAHHVYQTAYTLTTPKDVGEEPLRVAAIADSHIGITLDGEKFAAQIERIRQSDPDILLIIGDFVDDDTKKADMVAACSALGQLDLPYGVYFVYGNHDEGYFGYRNFTAEELRTELVRNQIKILEDECVLIDNRFYLAGRKDRSMPERMEAEELTAGLDPSKYTILLDHQPNDYEGEEASGADLVLSGHTHGGHIFPVGLIGLAAGANDRVYGKEQRGNTTFIVTSGISGWAVPFKTGAISEYLVIDIQGKK